MAKLTTLKNKVTDEVLYPLTKTNAVSDSNGTSLDSLLSAINQNKQDALTFDTTPTAISQNPVTSGGVYNALIEIDSLMQSQIDVIKSNKAGKTETNTFTKTNTFTGTLVATALTNLTKGGSISGGIVDSIEDAYVSSNGGYFRIKWKSGFQMAGGWDSVNECSNRLIAHGLTFTGKGYQVLVSNSSGKTSGNTEGVVTGRPLNKTQIEVTAGYLDPNTSNFEWLVCGFSCQ